LARRTSESASGLWLTPSVADAGRTGSAEAWGKWKIDKRTTNARLRNQIHWPTPNYTMGDRGPRKPDGKRGRDLADLTGPNPTVQMWPTPKANEPGMSAKTSGRDISKSTHLTTQVALSEGLINPETGRVWPTPTARDYKGCGANGWTRDGKIQVDTLDRAVWRWPTPTAGDSTGSGNRNNAHSKAHPGISLTDAALTGDSSTPRSEVSGSLNPTWVEWLMGYPIGWTDLKD